MKLVVCPTIEALWEELAKWSGKQVGLVPTMGALHEGHGSLIDYARQLVGEDGLVVASIFVNPTQFGPREDFTNYPRTLEADLELLEKHGCNVVFTPAPEVMYPPSPSPHAGSVGVTVDPGYLGTVLEGALRPGHFKGVCTVVAKLLNIVQPHKLVMGQKDYQQNAVLRQMIRDLNMPYEHVVAPTVREADGLAMSSRNRYLTEEERPRAVALYEALTWAKEEMEAGRRNAEKLHQGMSQKLAAKGLVTQYAVACHSETLKAYRGEVPAGAECVLLIAAKLGNTRLIDNLIVE